MLTLVIDSATLCGDIFLLEGVVPERVRSDSGGAKLPERVGRRGASTLNRHPTKNFVT